MSEKDERAKKAEAGPRADEPATEAIPKTPKGEPMSTGDAEPKPPTRPDTVTSEPDATPPAKTPPAKTPPAKTPPAKAPLVRTKSPRPPAKPLPKPTVPVPESESELGEPAEPKRDATESAVSKSDATDPATTELDASKPDATKSDVSKSEEPPVAGTADAAETGANSEAETTAIPKVAAPAPRITEPTTTEPTAGRPTTSQPAASVPPTAVAKPTVGPRRIPPRAEDPAARGTLPQPRRIAPAAKPERIGPPPEKVKTRRRVGGRWIAALAAAVLVIVAVGVAGFLYLSGEREDNSPETQIRARVSSFTEALTSGDLETLRSTSCGEMAAYYRDIPDAEFADVHRTAVEQGNIPVVEGVDAVQITGDTAIAQVIAYTAANPNERSPRTFDLRLEGDEWKVCDPE